MDQKKVEQKISEIVRRIVASAHPKQIILFGSAARGIFGKQSDVDLLVIVPTGTNRRRTAQQLYCQFIGIGLAADLIVITEDDLKQFQGNPGLIIHPAMKEGKLLYAA